MEGSKTLPKRRDYGVLGRRGGTRLSGRCSFSAVAPAVRLQDRQVLERGAAKSGERGSHRARTCPAGRISDLP